ncbi:hypothetical protein IQ38_00100, partial [Mycobacterium tuberculosis]
TGIANPGHYNTGSYNTGSYNTGMANAGDYGTGAFITGSMNNGLLWRADRQGLLAANYTITIERPAAFLNVDIPVNIPITGDITNVSIPAITFPRIDASGSVDIGILSGTVLAPVGPITLHGGDASAPLDTPIEIDFGPSPAINLNIGKPDGSTVINIVGGAGAGPISIPIIDLRPAPGFFNATTGPSSGFLNWGAGSASGLLNFGNNSGLYNFATSSMGNSGFQNYGSLQSGWANLGNSISGIYNTGLGAPANVSGLLNIGTNLAGWLQNGPTETTFSVGLANLGFWNLGSANIGNYNLGSAN